MSKSRIRVEIEFGDEGDWTLGPAQGQCPGSPVERGRLAHVLRVIANDLESSWPQDTLPVAFAPEDTDDGPR